jgi:hypothetical protein
LLYLKDPLCFKEFISISLEVLPHNKYHNLKEFVQSIPSTVGLTKVDAPKEIEECINSCISEFKNTKTYFWLREDFKNALYDIEIQLNKKIS